MALSKKCPNRLSDLGWSIKPWWVHFPEAATETINDEAWIERVADLGFLNVLSKDDAMYRDAAICDTLRNCGVRLFTLNNQKLTWEAMVGRFEKHREEIWRRALVDQPMYNVVTADSIWRRF